MSEVPDAVAQVALAILPHRDAIISTLITEMEEEITALDRDERSRSLLAASVAENVIAALHMVGNGIDPHTMDAPPSATSYARRLAQRDVPLSALLRAYRLGQARFLSLALDEATRREGENTTATIIAIVNIAAAYIDRISEQVTHAYEEERERRVSSRGALRQHWLAQLLRDPAPDVARAESVLAYHLDGTHLAVEAWLDHSAAAEEATTVMESLKAVLYRAFEAHDHPLAVPTDEMDVRMWFPVRPCCPVDADAVTAELERAQLPVRVAIGTPRSGLRGFRRSIVSAGRAKRVSLSAGDAAPRAVSFSDVAPVALLVDEPAELADFVADVLGGLAVDDDWRASLRETLHVFLATNGSYAATAELLTVHRNTVHYRIQQTTEKYGVVLEGSAFELQLALTICRWHGPKVLHGAAPPARPGATP
jgi:DNA-binding PucR family transcriptional regulator